MCLTRNKALFRESKIQKYNRNDLMAMSPGVCMFLDLRQILGSRTTRPGVSSCPPGCKISSCNSTISIEPNFATFNEIDLVESFKYNLKWT